jgi:hypothetical protein
MTWQRARSEEQKQQRISEIVGATARLYKKLSFKAISFNDWIISDYKSFRNSTQSFGIP